MIARSAILDEITNQYVELAEKEFYEEERRRRLEDKEQNNDFFASITSCGRYDVFDPHNAKIAAGKVIAQLKSKKVDQTEKAQVQIKADLPSPETILVVILLNRLETSRIGCSPVRIGKAAPSHS